MRLSIEIAFLIFNLVYKVSQAEVNILYLNGVPSKSHYIWNNVLIEKLASLNYNLTVLSYDVNVKPHKNVHYLSMEDGYEVLYNDGPVKNDIMKRSREGPWSATLSYYKFNLLGCKGAISSQGFHRLLNYPDSFPFDIIIYDATCGGCLIGFFDKFGSSIPLITVVPFNLPQFASDLVAFRRNYGTASHFALSYGRDMSFGQRLHNFLIHMFDTMYRNYVFNPKIESLTKKYFPNMTTIKDLEEKTSLLFVNFQPGIDQPELLPSNIISVGGLQIVDPKPLPNDIKEFIESSGSGTVLFSLGTNIKSYMLPDPSVFIKTFKRFPNYNFIWKFDISNYKSFEELPKNLMIKSWVNQNDILAHSNVVAFMSHCGLLSTHEAVWHGVPVIGIPVYTDQHRNMYLMETAGIGVKLSIHNLTSETVYSGINEVLENPQYRKRMQQKSKIFRAQPQMPLERAIFWINWILENPELAQSISTHQYYGFFIENSLDVLTFILIATLMIFYFSIKIVYKIYCLLKKSKIDDNKKRN